MANNGGNTVPRIEKSEHIGPDDTGDNIQAKRVANYVWNNSTNNWERMTQPVGDGMDNPMTTLGDMIYEDATPTANRLPGNTSATKKFLTQTGDGANSATPVWGSVDLSTDVGSSVLPIANGGTNSATKNFVDLSTSQTKTADLILNPTQGGGSTEAFKTQTSGNDLVSMQRFVDASNGYSRVQITSVVNAPPIIGLVAPNGTDYADFTFNGSDSEVETSTGDLNLRPNLNGSTDYTGNVNIWSPTHTPKLRVGNNGFSAALDIYHDGSNAHLSSTTGGINVDSAANLQKLNVATGSNKSAGTGTLSGGTATISTTAVTANSLIFLTDTAGSVTNVGTLTVSAKSAGVSFTVTSTIALDSSTFNWLIVN